MSTADAPFQEGIKVLPRELSGTAALLPLAESFHAKFCPVSWGLSFEEVGTVGQDFSVLVVPGGIADVGFELTKLLDQSREVDLVFTA